MASKERLWLAKNLDTRFIRSMKAKGPVLREGQMFCMNTITHTMTNLNLDSDVTRCS
jgi:hypothetical protein